MGRVLYSLLVLLVVGMLTSGVANTLLTKYQDKQCVSHCDDPELRRTFEQPVWQTLNMFIGESGCWLVVLISAMVKSRHTYERVDERDDNDNPIIKVLSASQILRPLKGRRTLLLALPAVCDILGTTLVNVGLLFTPPSIYQMTRGVLVLFVGLFSVVFLRRPLYAYQWCGMGLVVLGVIIVGLSGALYGRSVNAEEPYDVTAIVFGVVIIALAQCFTASQFVLEEYILEQYAVEPIKVVGWEGIFGFVITVCAMLCLWPLAGVMGGEEGYFDLPQGWREITSNHSVWTTSIAIMFSIGSFNFFGLSVTRSISATSRSIFDTLRTLFVWIIALVLGWEHFNVLQLAGN